MAPALVLATVAVPLLERDAPGLGLGRVHDHPAAVRRGRRPHLLLVHPLDHLCGLLGADERGGAGGGRRVLQREHYQRGGHRGHLRRGLRRGQPRGFLDGHRHRHRPLRHPLDRRGHRPPRVEEAPRGAPPRGGRGRGAVHGHVRGARGQARRDRGQARRDFRAHQGGHQGQGAGQADPGAAPDGEDDAPGGPGPAQGGAAQRQALGHRTCREDRRGHRRRAHHPLHLLWRRGEPAQG
mmetsp:Transcript_2092/g.6052  ORF Transcript_2092/g.6052 Transcript_2092/m.6052 type:complete len:238 (-) Transcript_2092:569-1282(-)